MKQFAVLVLFIAGALAEDNIVQVAEKLNATELVKLVTAAGLADTLSSKGPFTVFAPTNEAFGHLPRQIVNRLMHNKTELTDLLEYHVLSGTVKSTDLSNEETAPSLFAKHSVRVNIYDEAKGKLVTVDGSPVIKVDQLASNGVIHVISKVLFPIPEGTITDLVSHDHQLSVLLTAVQKANLAATLAGAGPYTVFAPTDQAFQRLPPGTLNKLLANVTALTDVLTYHVVKGTFYTEGLKEEQDVPSLEGKNLHIVKEGIHSVKVDQARVELPNVSVTNGVAHVIDSVLIPPHLADYLFNH